MNHRFPLSGIEVKEGTLHGVAMITARVRTETRWTCGACGTHWSKAGNHLGQFKKCRKCGVGGWLRAAT